MDESIIVSATSSGTIRILYTAILQLLSTWVNLAGVPPRLTMTLLNSNKLLIMTEYRGCKAIRALLDRPRDHDWNGNPPGEFNVWDA